MDNKLTIESLPPEVHSLIFSRLDLDSIKNARLVSRTWNQVMVPACSNFHLVCPISDSTLSTVCKSTQVLKSLNVRKLTGKGTKVVSATRGAGRIFGNAERIQFTGTSIDPAESLKMMYYAFNTVKELVFIRCGHAIIRPLLQTRRIFQSLNQLTIECTLFAKKKDPRALGNLPIPDYHAEMPSLQIIKLIMKGPVTGLNGLDSLPLEDIFLNHVAIVKLLIKYRHTLKSVIIERTDSFRDAYDWLISYRDPNNTGIITLTDPELDDAKVHLDQLENMNLDQVVIHSEQDNLPWNFEHQLIQGQRNLKAVDINNMRYPPSGNFENVEAESILSKLLPQNWTNLTSVKITLALDPEFHPIDLAGFRDCFSLQHLELVFLTPGKVAKSSAWLLPLRFKNIHRLPTQITSLSFKPINDEVNYPFHQTALLTTEQLRWIVQNMRCLESFGVHLIGAEIKKEEEEGNGNYPLYQVNQQANINLATFKKLISMQKMKHLDVYLVQAMQLAKVLKDDLFSRDHPAHWRDVYWSYIQMCSGTQNLNSQIRYCSGIDPSFNFVELKIRK